MKSDKLIRIAMRSINRTKMRSALTMLGIIIGVGAVIIMIAISAGTDPVAVDAAGVRIAEWNNRMSDPADIRHLALAAERGAGSLTTPEEQIFRSNLG